MGGTDVAERLIGAADDTLRVAVVGGIVSIIVAGIAAAAPILTRQDRKEAKSAATSAARSAKAAKADAQTIKAQAGTITALEERVRILEELVDDMRDAWAREREEWKLQLVEKTIAAEAATKLEKEYSSRIQSLERAVAELSPPLF